MGGWGASEGTYPGLLAFSPVVFSAMANGEKPNLILPPALGDGLNAPRKNPAPFRLTVGTAGIGRQIQVPRNSRAFDPVSLAHRDARNKCVGETGLLQSIGHIVVACLLSLTEPRHYPAPVHDSVTRQPAE